MILECSQCQAELKVHKRKGWVHCPWCGHDEPVEDLEVLDDGND